MSLLTEKRRAASEELMQEGILSAATAVLGEVGFQALTMERVARAAGVAKGTLYNYFKDKDDLVGQVIEFAFAGLVEQVETAMRAGASVRGTLRRVVALVLEGMEARRDLAEILVAGGLSEAVNARLCARRLWLRRQVAAKFVDPTAEGRLREGIAPEEAARALVVTLRGLVEERLESAADCLPVAAEVERLDRLVFGAWFMEVTA